MNLIPATFEYQNAVQSAVNPSTVHVRNSSLSKFFQRYLMQKAMAVYKWDMPKEWAHDYFMYALYYFGYVAVFDSDKFGAIPQQCTLSGYDVFYRPTHAVVANPLLPGLRPLKIGTECALIKLQPTYCGIWDIVQYYADLLALCAESAGVSLLNSHFAYVFLAKNDTQAKSYKKMYDMIASGEPCVVVDRTLFQDEQPQKNNFLDRNVKDNYIVSDLLIDMAKIEAQFDTMVGIPNANTDKRERLITDEVNANNFATLCRPALWLETLREGCAQVKEMFGVDINVDWRADNGESTSSVDSVNL